MNDWGQSFTVKEGQRLQKSAPQTPDFKRKCETWSEANQKSIMGRRAVGEWESAEELLHSTDVCGAWLVTLEERPSVWLMHTPPIQNRKRSMMSSQQSPLIFFASRDLPFVGACYCDAGHENMFGLVMCCCSDGMCWHGCTFLPRHL